MKKIKSVAKKSNIVETDSESKNKGCICIACCENLTTSEPGKNGLSVQIVSYGHTRHVHQDVDPIISANIASPTNLLHSMHTLFKTIKNGL